jgi:hypothetical protein
MRRVDVRVYVIVLLAVVAASAAFYRMQHPAAANARLLLEDAQTGAVEISAGRVGVMLDTLARTFGAPKKFITRRSGTDSGRTVPESWIGVPASFDDLRLIAALTDSLRAGGWSVAAVKNLKEKTTTIRLSNPDHVCLYRCILYRKELPH